MDLITNMLSDITRYTNTIQQRLTNITGLEDATGLHTVSQGIQSNDNAATQTIAEAEDVESLKQENAAVMRVLHELWERDDDKIPAQSNNNETSCDDENIPELVEAPSTSSNIYIVRISDKSKTAQRTRQHYAHLLQQCSNGQQPIWDKDSKNKIKPSDFLGFIVGPTYAATVQLFKVEAEIPQYERRSDWNTSNTYTHQDTTNVKDREVILLASQHFDYPWEQWKLQVGYKHRYMPRGTTLTKHPF